MTLSGDLLFTDLDDSSINLVSGTNVKKLIRLRGWKPRNLCSTSSGDILVIMESDYDEQIKVVRYSGSTKKQRIQWDDKHKPLYSSDAFTKYLSENKNLDICVADLAAGAVVVVSAAGKLRFRYTGPLSTPLGSFQPTGITTDSEANILTSDIDQNRIHIISRNGRFLRYINFGLERPWGLCGLQRQPLCSWVFFW